MLSLLLERTHELMLKKNNIDASPERIKEALNSLNIALFEIDKKEILPQDKRDRFRKQNSQIAT
jgi:adenylate kinase